MERRVARACRRMYFSLFYIFVLFFSFPVLLGGVGEKETGIYLKSNTAAASAAAELLTRPFGLHVAG